MKPAAADFLNAENKAVTIIGMSGIGKTRLGRLLSQEGWFHYSNDYRIGSAYMAGELSGPVWINDLSAISQYLVLPGDPAKGGLTLDEFRRRQKVYRDAEIAAAFDVPQFIEQAREKHRLPHFLNDTAGSLCELDRPDILDSFARQSVILYIAAAPQDEKCLFERAMTGPKPLYYHDAFFAEALDAFMKERGLAAVDTIDPAELYRWIFPRLFRARLPKYRKIADEHGFTVSSDALRKVQSSGDFTALIAAALQSRA